MPIQEKLYTVEELWEIAIRPDNAEKHLELIDGIIFEKDVMVDQEGKPKPCRRVLCRLKSP